MKNKKWLWILAIGLDVAVTVFLFVIHIIMLINIVGKTPEELQALRSQDNLFGALMRDNVLYLVGFVIPLFVILVINIVGLVFYVKKQTKKEPVQVNDLTDEQKEALKRELLQELQGDKKE